LFNSFHSWQRRRNTKVSGSRAAKNNFFSFVSILLLVAQKFEKEPVESTVGAFPEVLQRGGQRI